MRYVLVTLIILFGILGCSANVDITTIDTDGEKKDYTLPYNFGEYNISGNLCKIHIELSRNAELFKTDTSERIDLFIDYDLSRKYVKSAFFVRSAFRVSFGKFKVENIDIQLQNKIFKTINIKFISSAMDSSSINMLRIEIKNGVLHEVSKTKLTTDINDYVKEIIEKNIDDRWLR